MKKVKREAAAQTPAAENRPPGNANGKSSIPPTDSTEWPRMALTPAGPFCFTQETFCIIGRRTSMKSDHIIATPHPPEQNIFSLKNALHFKSYGLSFRGKNACLPLTLGGATPRPRVSPFFKVETLCITGRRTLMKSYRITATPHSPE